MPPLLNFIILVVKDVSTSTAFYREALGATLKSTSPNRNFAELTVGSVSLAVITTDTARDVAPSVRFCPPTPQSIHSSFISFLTNDLHQHLDRVIAYGGSVREQPRGVPWGGALALVSDPDGHLIELFQKD